MALQFVNVYGEALSEKRMAETAKLHKRPKPTVEKAPTHKGFAVAGHAPGSLEEARKAHARLVEMAEKPGGEQIKPFDEVSWLATTKKKRVAKPFSIRDAAMQCADLARKAGWLDVDVIELIS